MERLEKLRGAIMEVIKPLSQANYAAGNIQHVVVTDRETDNYLVIREGYLKGKNVYSVLIHLTIANDQITVLVNHTEIDLMKTFKEAGLKIEDVAFADAVVHS